MGKKIARSMTRNAKLRAADVAALERNHHTLLSLCLLLEEIATSGPSEIAPENWRTAADAMQPLLEDTHELEERSLFASFDRTVASPLSPGAVQRLRAEHRGDAHACKRVLQALTRLEAGNEPLVEQADRQLVTGFAEALRRHILCEQFMLETLIAAKDDRSLITT